MRRNDKPACATMLHGDARSRPRLAATEDTQMLDALLYGRKKTTMVDPEDALPGRQAPSFRVPERHEVLGTPLEGPFPSGLETAIFGLGCFWGAERLFWDLAGGLQHRRRLRRRLHPVPHLRGGLLRQDGSRRGRPGRLRPRERSATTTC